jgi:protein-L-isoaspartate(D-aspartate) O-methyltransferase
VAQKKLEAVASLLLRLRTAGIMDKRLFEAFEAVPRQNFVPIVFLDVSYSPGSFPIECGQSMESADQLARILLALDVQPGNRILEIGTGSGYVTALLAHMGGKVTSLDRYRTLIEKARQRLSQLKVDNATFEQRDGRDGIPGQLYDRIYISGAIEQVPKQFLDQLASNGILVAPIGPGDGVQTVTKLTKIGSRFEKEELFETRSQPLAPGVARAI